MAHWLAGASPALFDAVERVDQARARWRADGSRLAERVGEELVPDPDLSREDRALLLNLRRQLHQGALTRAVSPERVTAIRSLSHRHADLLAALAHHVDRDVEIGRVSDAVDEAVVSEQERLLGLPGRLRVESPVAEAVLGAAGPEADAAGASPKARRHRAEYEWRWLVRASTSSTPRGWFSHVAVLPISNVIDVRRPKLAPLFMSAWTENVRARRRAAADPPPDWPTPDVRVALNPLQWSRGDRLVSLVPDDGDGSIEVVVRWTAFLEAIHASLRDGPRTLEDMAIAVGCASEDERAGLREFVRHLVALGIIEASARHATAIDRSAVPGRGRHGSEPSTTADGWVDVYRVVDGVLPSSLAMQVQAGALQALRLISLAQPDRGYPTHAPESDRSWTLAEILAAELDTQGGTSRAELEEDGRGGTSTGPLSDLLRAIARRTEPGATVEISPAELDAAGAADDPLVWPSDCLIRVPAPEADFAAVLESFWPPGVLDARFAESLRDIHGAIPHVEAYAEFLHCVEELTGILLVEVLAPPLTDGAANAVRRPAYTRAWTGDPHSGGYMSGDPGRYIPLPDIRIRRVRGRLRADFHDQQIWPVYHATRSFSPPWDRIAQILLASAPRDIAHVSRSLLASITVPQGMTWLPRIAVSGGIILAPAQWLLAADEVWDSSAPVRHKIAALARIRRRCGLPRWVWVVPPGDETQVPLDLESLQAIRVLERFAATGAHVRVVEMLPAPDGLLVVDGSAQEGHAVASQVQLRLPFDQTPASAAARIAPILLASLHLEHQSREGTSPAAHCRDPPAVSVPN